MHEFRRPDKVRVSKIESYVKELFKQYTVVHSEIECDIPIKRETVFLVLDYSNMKRKPKRMYRVNPHAGNFDDSNGLESDNLTIICEPGAPSLDDRIDQIQMDFERL